MRNLLSKTLERILHYLETLSSRPVAPTAEALQALRQLDTPLQQDSLPAERVLKELDELV